MQEKAKLYLLTGFLGAGKTTFLQNVLNDLKEEKVAVIMNEFGRVNIDGPVVQKDGMELIELNRGSIFCSCLQLSFVSALVEMADRGMEYVFVESSGLADPSNIGEFLDAVTVAKGHVYDYRGAICLVDGLNFLDQIEDMETIERQLKYTHLVIVSKVDLISVEELEKVRAKIQQINDKVDIVDSVKGHIDYDFLQKDLTAQKWLGTEDSTNTPENRPKALTLSYERVVSKEELTRFLDAIKQDSYRIKGFFELEEGWNQVDVVGKRVDYKKTSAPAAGSRLVIISRIGPQLIKPIFKAWDEAVGKKMILR